MQRVWIFCLLLSFLVWPQSAFLMESTNFKVVWDSVNTGGDDISTSTNFLLRDTTGQSESGIGFSETYQVASGYRAQEVSTSTLALTVRAQETATRTTSTSFSNAGTSVEVQSASGFSVGDYIAVVENIGFSQMVTVGKIVSIASNVLTVDAWSGDQASMSAQPAGANDFVFRLGSSSIRFGTIYQDSQNTVVAMTSVVSSISSGYSVYVQTDHPLQIAPGTAIPATMDGLVTAGGDEYGARATGATAANTATDVGISTTQQAIQASANISSTVGDRVAMSYKLSVSGLTSFGAYTQNVFYTLTANF